MSDTVHLHVNRLNRRANIFLLFLPALIFAILLALLLQIQPQKEVATTSEPSILGDEVETLP
jgi:hypothetical protein